MIEPCRPWDKADWIGFKSSLKATHLHIPENMTDKKLDRLVKHFYNNINEALDRFCPMTKRISRDKDNPWYTERIEDLRTNTMEAFYDLRRRGGDRENFTKAKK